MKDFKMSFVAAGDMLIQRKISTAYDGFEQLKKYISKADVRFFNLETTLHNGEYFGNQFYGGSYLYADPSVLDIAKEYGFNMLSFANNHTMDYSYGGMLATLDNVNKAGFVNAGVGKNLDDAAAPGYLDTPSGRAALISVVSTMMNPAAMAGKQSRQIIGRPGVNPLRFDEKIELTPEQFEIVEYIAQNSDINAKDNISRAEGYQNPLPDGITVLKDLKFFKGNKTYYHTSPNQEDVDRVKKAIYEAQMHADYVIISIHSHEVGGKSKETPAPFLEEFAHMCIDSGANAVIGHGPHLIRPLEIYKGCPIFYSLGDFMLHNESIPKLPEDLYEKYGLTSDNTMRELFCKRSANYTRGLMTDRRMFESFIPYFEIENGKMTHLELLPIELDFEEPRWKNGNPHVRTDCNILERLAEMSAAYGTKISIDEHGIGIVEL
ncbi:MAG: CapA family protein [Ruminococcaceae bacterium]|nr:CapA family protein [Oscillospiraceae bacterium]